MLDATLTWDAATTGPTTGVPTGYVVVWTYNGAAQTPVTVPANAAQDASGYSLDFGTTNPTLTVKAGDTIGATVQTIDAANNLLGPVVPSTPTSVTEPTTPVAPGPALNVVLTLS